MNFKFFKNDIESAERSDLPLYLYQRDRTDYSELTYRQFVLNTFNISYKIYLIKLNYI